MRSLLWPLWPANNPVGHLLSFLSSRVRYLRPGRDRFAQGSEREVGRGGVETTYCNIYDLRTQARKTSSTRSRRAYVRFSIFANLLRDFRGHCPRRSFGPLVSSDCGNPSGSFPHYSNPSEPMVGSEA